jgi:hypothetical protein
VWSPTGKAVGVTGTENASLAIDSHLERARNDHATFLSIMRESDPAGVRTRLITFVEDLQLAPEEVLSDLSV